MKLPSPSTTPMSAANGILSLPYKWDTVVSKLGLAPTNKISVFVLGSIFLSHWTKLRDQMPLTPKVAVDIIAADDENTMTDFCNTIYTAMDSMATSKYDRPTSTDRANWKSSDYLECLVYQCARDLVQAGCAFYSKFERPKLKKNEAGRKYALIRILGLAILVTNLIVNYTLMSSSIVIQKIKIAKPARDPSRSPITEVRRKWHLEHMDLSDLRKTVLDRQRRGGDGKEWLIGILVKDLKDGVLRETNGEVVVKKESVKIARVKRKNEDNGNR